MLALCLKVVTSLKQGVTRANPLGHSHGLSPSSSLCPCLEIRTRKERRPLASKAVPAYREQGLLAGLEGIGGPQTRQIGHC